MTWLSRLNRDNIRKIVNDPRMLRELSLPPARKLNGRINRFLHEPDPSVMGEDWDTLIILDACRADTFTKHSDIISASGQYQRRVSLATSSEKFIEKTFGGEEYHDTVYVSANPFLKNIAEGTFHAVWSLLGDKYWNDELDTVLPETVAKAGIKARNEFPDKRLVLHFMQPHYPFIGEKGRKVYSRGYNRDMDNQHLNKPSIWYLLKRNPTALNIEDIRNAYEENLQIVLGEVNDLLNALNGESITITADHGNFLGERLWPIPISDYGHPGDSFAPGTAFVPWYEIMGDDRPRIQSDPPELASGNRNEAIISDRLEALGYRE